MPLDEQVLSFRSNKTFWKESKESPHPLLKLTLMHSERPKMYTIVYNFGLFECNRVKRWKKHGSVPIHLKW